MGRPMTQGILDVDGLVTTGTDGKTINQTMQDIKIQEIMFTTN